MVPMCHHHMRAMDEGHICICVCMYACVCVLPAGVMSLRIALSDGAIEMSSINSAADRVN